MQRRNLLVSSVLGAGTLALAGCGAVKKYTGLGTASAAESAGSLQQRLQALEARSGGRLGVFVQSVGSDRSLSWREDESFPMCSTFKLLLAARVLHLAQLGEFPLEQALLYEKGELVSHSPVTELHADAEGMTLRALSEAAMVASDNTAANLLLGVQGGPAGLTRWLRTLGDMKTRLDRNEPALNSAIAGDPRDTTTPRAMARTAMALLTDREGKLSKSNQLQLIDWMMASRTADKRMRAGLPQGWKIGSKSGTGENGTANEVGIIWPGGNAQPMLAAVYLTGATRIDSDAREATLAEVGRLIAQWHAAA